MLMTSKYGKKWPRETAWGDGQRQARRCGTRAVVWAVEWAALLVGLLPCGGHGGCRPRPKAVLSLAAAGMALFLNVTFIAAYFERNLRNMYETAPRVMYFSCLTSYSVMVLGSFVMLPFLWFQCAFLSQLLEDLRSEQSLSNTVTGKRLLHFVFSLLYVSLDFIMSVILQVLWNEHVFAMPYENVVFTFSAVYSVFLIPSILTFPLVLMVTVIHVLHVALADANETLQLQFGPRPAGLSEPPSEHRHRDQVYALRSLRARYVHLRRLYQVMADIFAAPLMIWTLHKIFTIILLIFGAIAWGEMDNKRAAIAVECFLSLFLLGFLADGITVQASAPQSIILDGYAAFMLEKTQPEVESQVTRLLKTCEKPLVIRPWGLYTVSRSNLLAVSVRDWSVGAANGGDGGDDLHSGAGTVQQRRPHLCENQCSDANTRKP